jgi:hypothetical protein
MAGSTQSTANHCTSVGDDAYKAGTGNENTVLGSTACTGALTGSNNTIIGYDAEQSANNVSNEITLGNASVTKFRIPGLNFSIKDSTATDNYVLTVDSNGDAGWEAAGGGGGKLTLISSTTFTSATSAVNFTSISGYTQYKIIFNLQTGSGAGTFRMRTGIDGTYDTGSNYNKGGSSASYIEILGGFSATSKHGEITIFDLNQSESTLVYSHGVGHSNDETSSSYQTSSGAHLTESAQNCIQLYGGSGNMASGIISLYGIATS